MTARYDGLSEEYEAFVDRISQHYVAAEGALRRLLGPGPGRCLDIGCGGGHLLRVPVELGWAVVGVDLSKDQLERAAARYREVELAHADASALPFEDGAFDAAYSSFTHTDFDEFAAAVGEAKRVIRPGGRFVYIGNHPCFVGPTQDYTETGIPLLHPGYRRAGRWQSSDAPGVSPDGWRARLGSFVHLPLADLLCCFAGLTLVAAEEPADGYEYPKTLALAFTTP